MMAAGGNDFQFRPLCSGADPDLETGVDDSVSVRALRDMMNNLNNFKAHFGPVLFTGAWPAQNILYNPGSGTAERLRIQIAPVYVGAPGNYDRIAWSLGGAMVSGAAGTTTWTLYACQRIYLGAAALTSGDKEQLGVYFTDAITFSDGTTHKVHSSTCQMEPSSAGYIYLFLTGQNSSGGAGDSSYISCMTATAKRA